MSSPEAFALADALAVNADGASPSVEITGARYAARLTVELSDVSGEVSVQIEASRDGVSWRALGEAIEADEALSLSTTVGGVERFLRASWRVEPGASARITVTGEAHQSYATLSDLVRYGLPEGALQGVSDSERVEQLLAASAIADGPLAAAGFVLPLISWGDDLREAVASIAAAGCLVHRGFSPEGSDGVIIERGEARRKWLDGVGDGGRISPATKGTPPPVVAAGAVVVSKPRRGWGER